MKPRASFKAAWFGYSILAVFGWGAWAILSKLGARELPAPTLQFLYAWGGGPLALLLLIGKRFKLEKDLRGILYGIANGVIAGAGNVAFLTAFRRGGNTSLVTATTALYPMVTVLLALLILRERLSRLQVLGLGFAAIAILIFSV